MSWLADLQRMESGLYVWAVPDQPSIMALQIFECLMPRHLDYENTTNYHATVLHCRDMSSLVTSDAAEACICYPLHASRIQGVPTVWLDHKDRPIMVMLLDCPELQERNRRLQASGLPHSYHEFNPHITLGKLEQGVDPEEAQAEFRDLWSSLARPLAFETALKYSLCG